MLARVFRPQKETKKSPGCRALARPVLCVMCEGCDWPLPRYDWHSTGLDSTTLWAPSAEWAAFPAEEHSGPAGNSTTLRPPLGLSLSDFPWTTGELSPSQCVFSCCGIRWWAFLNQVWCWLICCSHFLLLLIKTRKSHWSISSDCSCFLFSKHTHGSSHHDACCNVIKKHITGKRNVPLFRVWTTNVDLFPTTQPVGGLQR